MSIRADDDALMIMELEGCIEKLERENEIKARAFRLAEEILQRKLQETTDNAISQGARLQQRIAELEAKLENYRHGLPENYTADEDKEWF